MQERIPVLAVAAGTFKTQERYGQIDDILGLSIIRNLGLGYLQATASRVSPYSVQDQGMDVQGKRSGKRYCLHTALVGFEVATIRNVLDIDLSLVVFGI